MSPQILCLGELLFDYLSNQPGLPYEQVTAWTPYPGGAPANVACALAKLGTPAGFVGCVGSDEAGDALVQVLRDSGVDVLGVQRHPTAPTRGVYVVRSREGDRHFASFGDFDTAEFADTHLQADLLPESLFQTADYLVLGTLELAYPESRAAIERSLHLAQQHFLKIFVDVNWRPVFWGDPEAARETIRAFVQSADFLKLSAEEADWLFDTRDPGIIAHRLESEGVLISNGEHGCSYCFGELQGTLPAFNVGVEDTTGAGDAFAAGFLHQLCRQGLSALTDPTRARQIMRYASAVGALTTTKAGAIAAQPRALEVETFLKK